MEPTQVLVYEHSMHSPDASGPYNSVIQLLTALSYSLADCRVYYLCSLLMFLHYMWWLCNLYCLHNLCNESWVFFFF